MERKIVRKNLENNIFERIKTIQMSISPNLGKSDNYNKGYKEAIIKLSNETIEDLLLIKGSNDLNAIKKYLDILSEKLGFYKKKFSLERLIIKETIPK